MKTLHKFFALTAAMALLASSAYSQDYAPEYHGGDEQPYAYEDSGNASYTSALIPIGALVIAGIIIASTDRHHHHNSSSSSSSHSHSHFSHSSPSSSFSYSGGGSSY